MPLRLPAIPRRLPVHRLLAAGLAITASLACQAEPEPPPSPEPLAYFTVEPDPLALTVGQQVQLRAVARSASGAAVGAVPVTWQVSNLQTATVSASGLFTAVARGNGWVTVRGGGREGTAPYTITTVQHPISVTVEPGGAVLVMAGGAQLRNCVNQGGSGVQTCSVSVDAGTFVSLDASIVHGWQAFTGWSGGPCGTALTCRFTVSAPVSVTARFATATPANLNLQVYAAIMAQNTQTLEGTVDLLDGRDALIRVFVQSNQSLVATGTTDPKVRVRLYHGATEVRNWLIPRPEGWHPALHATGADGSTSFTHNVIVPGSLVVPGLRLLAEVDPERRIPEQNENDNQMPVTGIPRDIPVHVPPPLRLRVVPVRQVATGLQADVSPAELAVYLQRVRRYLPLGAVQSDIRGLYVSNGPALTGDDANNGWKTLLSELEAVRLTDGAAGMYYYGMVRPPYTAGIGGMAPRPATAQGAPRVAAGRYEPVVADQILAHELGHAFGRPHAPCGVTADVDPFYPDRGGRIVGMGYEVSGAVANQMVPSTYFDVMGYCLPSWASAFTWNEVMRWRTSAPGAAPPPAPAGGPDDGLLVWGRVGPEGVTLEPAFRAAPVGEQLPPAGAWRVEGFDAEGRPLFRRAFDPVPIADAGPAPAYLFAMVLPVGAALADRLATLRVGGPGGVAERRAAAVDQADPRPELVRTAGGVELRWDPAEHPVALVREAGTGTILSFARGGRVALPAGIRAVDLQLSDGIRVRRRAITVR